MPRSWPHSRPGRHGEVSSSRTRNPRPGSGWLTPPDYDARDGTQNADSENSRAEHENLGRDADPGRAVHPHRERGGGAADEVRGYEVVDGQGERHQRPGQDAGHDERESDLAEDNPGIRPEVRGGLLQ